MLKRRKKKNLVLNPGDAVLYRYDKDFGFWGIPDITRRVIYNPIPDSEFEVSHNAQGNRDISQEPGRIDKSILCLGGSHTWGIGIGQDQRYTEYLRKELDRPVYNLGHCSLGLDQICLFILQRAIQFKPEVIVVEQYPWAIHRVFSSYVNGYLKPNFYLDADEKIRLKKLPWLSRYAFFRRLVGSIYQYRKELLEFNAGIDLSVSYDPKSDPIFLYWKAWHYDSMYRLVENIMVIMRDFANQQKIRLLFVLGAIQQQFGPQSRSALVDYDLPLYRLVELLEKRNISYIDMTGPMLNAHSENEPVIFQDGHMNQKGHHVFSVGVLTKIQELGWSVP